MSDGNPDLFAWAEAQAARDEAVSRVAANAEDACPGFADRATACVLAYLREHGPTPGERLTDACREAGIRPHDDRAFGAVFASLARQRLIRKAGSCLRVKGHLTTGGNVWEAL